MCQAKDFIIGMKELLSDMHNQYHLLKERISKLDKKISELYHEIERTPFSENTGKELYEELQMALQERRDAKFEWQNMYNLISTIGTTELRKKLSLAEKNVNYSAGRLEEWKGESVARTKAQVESPKKVEIASTVIQVVKAELKTDAKDVS